MGAQRKADIRRLASEAYQLEGRVTAGKLHRNPEDGRWMVGDTPLNTWFERNAGEDITLFLIPTASERAQEKQVCLTCGRDYVGSSCPYCREVRFRLRGR